MDFAHKVAISYYKVIAVINEPHHIYLVQHRETQKIYIKKILEVYNLDIYEYLYKHAVAGTPKIIDYYEEAHKLIVIEEYISGVSLQEKLQNSDLSEKDILAYMTDLCNILEQLHTTKPAIIHRDIKPSNVIITSYNRAVLLDFNAAKYYSASSADTVLLGTQGYAAPEQYGFGASSPQTDIYSLGVLLKEMLACVNCRSRFFDFIVIRCTQMEPTERFCNVNELKNALSGLSQPEHRQGTPKRVWKYAPPGFRTRTPWKMAAASLFYAFIAWVCFSLEVKDAMGAKLWLNRIFAFAILLSIVFGIFNYLDMQSCFPLCRSKNRWVRYLGIVFLDILVVFALFSLLMILEGMFFSV